MNETPLTTGELDDLARALDHITTDLIDRLAIAATDPWTRNSIAGPHVQTQPCSRPPYNLNAEILLTTLRETLATTITAICTHRNTSRPDMNSLASAASWIRKHRIALQAMPDGRTHHTALCRIVQQAARSSRDDQEYCIPKYREDVMVAAANKQVVTGAQVERMAHKLGDQARGLTRKRVTYLRNRNLLNGTRDDDTGEWFYYLGDILTAHATAATYRRKLKTAN